MILPFESVDQMEENILSKVQEKERKIIVRIEYFIDVLTLGFEINALKSMRRSFSPRTRPNFTKYLQKLIRLSGDLKSKRNGLVSNEAFHKIFSEEINQTL